MTATLKVTDQTFILPYDDILFSVCNVWGIYLMYFSEKNPGLPGVWGIYLMYFSEKNPSLPGVWGISLMYFSTKKILAYLVCGVFISCIFQKKNPGGMYFFLGNHMLLCF
jgi:hypothetical protein